MDVNLVGGGKIPPGRLGFVLPHEHLRVRSEGTAASWPWLYDEESERRMIVEKMKGLVSSGVDTIFDLSVYGLGRDAALMENVSSATGIQIVASTGLYTFTDLPRLFQDRGKSYLADVFVREIEDGIWGSETKASIIKCATDRQGVTQDVEKTLRAAAIAHSRTGVPIYTHSYPGNRSGLSQARIFREEGAEMSRVVIGHSGDTEDIEYLRLLLREGVYIGLDRFGSKWYPPTMERIEMVLRLIGEGFSDRILLSHDASTAHDRYHARYEPYPMKKRSYTLIQETVIPELLKKGVPQETIDQITRENPKRLFE